LLITSYITLPDLVLTKAFLQKNSIEGAKSFNSAWDELKETGYLKVHFYPSTKGWRTEYELLDEPQDGAHTFYHSANGTVTNTNLTKSIATNKAEADIQRTPQNGIYANGCNADGNNANGAYVQGSNANGGNNIKLSNKTNHNISVNNPINQSAEASEVQHPKKRLIDGIAEKEYETYEELIKDNISYDHLVSATIKQPNTGRIIRAYDPDELDELVFVMLDTICSKKETMRVGGEEKPAAIIKSQLLKLNESHIEYVLDCLKNNTTKIHNIRAYLLTALYNAPSSISSHYSAEYRHDFYGGGMV